MYKIDSFTNKPKEPVRHVYLMLFSLDFTAWPLEMYEDYDL